MEGPYEFTKEGQGVVNNVVCLKPHITYRGVQKPNHKRDHLTCQRQGTAILAAETAEEGPVDCIWLPHVLGSFP